jgi:hypothetical protein
MPTPEEIAKAEADAKAAAEKNKPDLAKELEALKAKNAEYEAKIKELSKEDPSLLDKARQQRKDDNQKGDDMKSLENALKFSLKSEEFLKTNASLLPKDVEDVFKAAEKENYGNAIEKVSAIKAGIIQSFFSVQANTDLLTPGLKTSLDDYLKLTKNGKQEKASQVYDQVFEPAFEMLKRVKKAEVLNKGYGDDSDFDVAYKNKMMKLSKEVHLREKS